MNMENKNIMSNFDKKTINSKGFISEEDIEKILKLMADISYGSIFGNTINDLTGELSGEGKYRPEYLENLAWYKEIDKETWEINDSKIKAYYLKNPKETKKTVVLIHGFSSSPMLVGGWARLYYDLGYNLLTPELRAHGSSEYEERSMGWKDREDIVAWVNELNKKNGDDAKVVLSGVSLGASAVMMSTTAGLPKNVKAIIDDCGFTAAYEQINLLLSLIFKPNTAEKILNLINEKLEHNQGIKIEDISAIAQIKKSTIPLLIIHGDSDSTVPPQMAQDLYDAALGEAELIFIKGAKHPTAVTYDLPKYIESLSTFLNKY